MKIQILGTGCSRCKMLLANVTDAVKELSMDVEIIKVENIDEIMNFGIMVTPALAVNGTLKSTGKVLTKEEIKKILKGGK